jgi:voltage-gated potassium channel
MSDIKTPQRAQKEIGSGRLEAYRIKADPAIAIISAFYLVLLLVPRVAITSLDSARVITTLDIIFWAILVVDLTYRIAFTTNPRERLWRIVALLLLATGVLALFRISGDTRDIVRLALIAVVAIRAVNSVRFFFKLRSMIYILSAVVLIVLAFGVSMTATEEHKPDANINSLSDGLWWAVSTVTTVGYGDKFPVTNSGRVLATGLMFLGVVLFSILTATLASSFASRSDQESESQFLSLHERLDRIERNQLTRVPARRKRAPKRPRRTVPAPRMGTHIPENQE